MEDQNKTLLVLIVPLALIIIFAYQFWYLTITMGILIFLWQVWQSYQWKQWSLQVEPIFQDLIQENQGCLTALTLSIKTNLTLRSAQNFLEQKVKEYGAQKQYYQQETIYYFLTSNVLETIFDESEPLVVETTVAEIVSENEQDLAIKTVNLVIEDQEDLEDEYRENEDEDQEDLEDEYRENEDIEDEAQEQEQSLGILSLGALLDQDLETKEVAQENTHHELTIQEMAKLVEVKENEPLPDELQETNLEETSVQNIVQLVKLEEKDNLKKEVESLLIEENSASITLEETKANPSKNQKKIGSDYTLRLKQNELAKRLEIHYNTIGKRKSDPDFPQWTQKRDPEGIAWEYLPKIRLFAPVKLEDN